MTISIKIYPNNQLADLSIEKDNILSSKKIALSELSRVFSASDPVKKDTGYLPKELLREVISKNSTRYYHFPSVVTEVCILSRGIEVKEDNPYGIRGDSDYIYFPDFIYRDVLGVIVNNLNEEFSHTNYRVTFPVPNLFGTYTSASTCVQLFPNHFYERICWPTDFDTYFLKSKDARIQSSFVPKYLSTKFNTDIFQRVRLNRELFEKELVEEFSAFMCECFEVRAFNSLSEINDKLYENSLVTLFGLYFFLSNIKNQNLTAFLDLEESGSFTLDTVVHRFGGAV